jgi:hypothetical protein
VQHLRQQYRILARFIGDGHCRENLVCERQVIQVGLDLLRRNFTFLVVKHERQIQNGDSFGNSATVQMTP